MRTSITRSLAARLPLVAAAGLVAGALAAPLPSHAAADVPPRFTATEGPYCPDHPDVPLFGTWLSTRVTGGHHIDVYEVPYFWGYKLVDVRCD